jgi:hypothetical protein
MENYPLEGGFIRDDAQHLIPIVDQLQPIEQ